MLKVNCSSIVLFGFKCSGKTFFGRLLAELLNVPFIDTDDLIEKLYEAKVYTPRSCRQIALNEGETFFRELEAQVIQSLSPESPSVIALGGGAILNAKNREFLQGLGKLVYLVTDKEIVYHRIFSNGIPSLFDPTNPLESFEKCYVERKERYESIDAYKIEIRQKSDVQVLIELKSLF
jgi:shikimate kinase